MHTFLCKIVPAVALLVLPPTCSAVEAQPAKIPKPQLVAHRGLLKHAPENTLAAFGACLDLQLGFELDVRRSRDGQLVCVHDEDVKRTTDGQGKVAELTLAELRKLDAGRWFDPSFAGQRVPTIEEIFLLFKKRQPAPVLMALDIKVEGVEEALIGLAKKHGVLNQVVCIGLAINQPAVRRKLRAAARAPVAVLAQTAKDLPLAIADRDADWVYVRFVPSKQEIASIHQAGKRVFIAGPTVAGQEAENWKDARAAGVDAVLTDYPLECRKAWREK